jgi:hypothetical protein
MSLIKSKGNMYSWVTHHWSPIKGCKHACPYCYVQKFDKDWDKPRLDEKDLMTNLGKGKTIFVGSKCDMWGSWVPQGWIQLVIARCSEYPESAIGTAGPSRSGSSSRSRRRSCGQGQSGLWEQLTSVNCEAEERDADDEERGYFTHNL